MFYYGIILYSVMRMSDRGKDQSVVAIDPRIAQSGSKAQIYYALERRPEGLAIEDIAKITGLTENTSYIRIRELFNAQMVEETRDRDHRVYRLKAFDISVDEKPHAGRR